MLWSLNFFWFWGKGVRAPTFVDHSKFRVKKFLEFFNLQIALDSEFLWGGPGTNNFWSCQIWGQNFSQFFFLVSTLVWIFWRGDPGTNFSWSHQISGQKVFRIFSFTKHSGLWIFWRRGLRHQLLLVMPNLEPKIFQNFFLYRALWILNWSRDGVQAPMFFGHAKFEVKKFENYFPLLSTLGVVWSPTFFGHPKFEVKKFSEFFPLLSTLDSEFLQVGSPVTNFFWLYQIWYQKVFRIFSFTDYSGLWIFQLGDLTPTFFGHCKFEVRNFQKFFLYRALWTLNFLGRVGVWEPTFFGHAKFEVEKFWEFFH